MSEETATNPVEGEEPASGVVEAEADLETTETEGDGDAVQPEDDSEEIEHEGAKYRIPKALKPALMMQADYTRKTQEVAETRRALEARETEIAQQAEANQAFLGEAARVQALADSIAQYEQIDWDQLAALDAQNGTREYDRYWRSYQKAQADHAKATGDLTTKVQQRALDMQQATAKQIQDGYAKLPELIPGWSPDVENKVAAFGRSEGFSQQELAQAVAEPRNIKILHLAMIGAESLKQQQRAKQVAKQQELQPAKTVSGKASSPPVGLDDRLPPEEWVRRRNAQLAKRSS